ncbi:MAG TPA: ATP-binding protein [Caldilineaceae bacterium]|nr:ATP-binding protein [Caldilineaceae bacterium]
MNRLWVRLSLVISRLILVSTLIPLITFLFFVLTHEPPPATTPAEAGPAVEQRAPDPWHEIRQNLLQSFLLAAVFGIGGGVVVSQFLASPITRLARAAQAIGGGNLSTRVQIKPYAREIDELAASFNKMAADLQHAAELRNNLMADVSHELRTPLTVLEGNLRAALDHVYELDEEQIANLYEQTRHLIRLVNELRELALVEAAQLPLERQPVDLAQLVQETVAVFDPLAEEKGVTLTAELEGLSAITGDRSRIRQVLHNLLANALRHTPTGGKVTIWGRSEAGRVTLAVQDSGEGIDAQQIEHVFDRFYRTDPSRSRETGGSGLGLAIVKAIVEAHGGAIRASSAGLGQGSTFTMIFPSGSAA